MDAQALYSILRECAQSTAIVERVLLGINWTIAQTRCDTSPNSSGLCFSPLDIPRNLDWPGTLVGRKANELVTWIERDEPSAVAVGLATINAVLNHSANNLLRDAIALEINDSSHLAVFDYFSPQLTGASVAIIGRYPGLDRFKSQFNFTCIERRPGPDDLPESAAETILPQSDWVFITASSLANKTLPHLLQLSRDAKVVLMGPTMPWMAEWADFGVDYLAGVEVIDPQRLEQIVAEAGGTRIFHDAVQYRVLSLC